MYYRAKITEESDGTWFVSFPDCEGCTTYGDTKAEALELAPEALSGWLETHLVTGKVPPAPAAARGTRVFVGAKLSSILQIRWARDSAGLSQTALAKRAGVTQQAIAKLENPDANPTLATLEKVAAALGVRVEVELVGTAA